MTVVCPQCGFENPEGARFCAGCGKPLEAPTPARELRKTVTVFLTSRAGAAASSGLPQPAQNRAASGLANWHEGQRTAILTNGR